MTNISSFSETKTYLYNINICGQLIYWLTIPNCTVKFKIKKLSLINQSLQLYNYAFLMPYVSK